MILSALQKAYITLQGRAKVVTLTKKSYQFVLSLQGRREKPKSRTTGQKTVHSCVLREFGAHTYLGGQWGVTTFWPVVLFPTFLGAPAGTAQIGATFSSMVRL